MSKQQNDLANALHQAIGANTRTILGRIVATGNINDGRVTAFSEMFGNLEVIVGSIRWLRINDVIFIMRSAPEEKYQPNIYIGWAGNLDGYLPGTPLMYNNEVIATVPDLPTEAQGARLGDVRSVGATADIITGIVSGGTLYVYAEIGPGNRQWTLFGSSSGGGQPSFGWYVEGVIQAGTAKGPIYRMQYATVISSFAANAKVADVASNDVTFDVRTSADRVTWTSIFSVLPVMTSGTSLATPGTLAYTSFAAGTYVRFDIVSYLGITAADVTADIFLGASL